MRVLSCEARRLCLRRALQGRLALNFAHLLYLREVWVGQLGLEATLLMQVFDDVDGLVLSEAARAIFVVAAFVELWPLGCR